MLFATLKAIRADQEGATAIEYALIASLIAVGIVTSILALGNEVQTNFEQAETAMQDSNV